MCGKAFLGARCGPVVLQWSMPAFRLAFGVLLGRWALASWLMPSFAACAPGALPAFVKGFRLSSHLRQSSGPGCAFRLLSVALRWLLVGSTSSGVLGGVLVVIGPLGDALSGGCGDAVHVPPVNQCFGASR